MWTASVINSIDQSGDHRGEIWTGVDSVEICSTVEVSVAGFSINDRIDIAAVSSFVIVLYCVHV